MMKSVVANTILESSDKKFTNHSARKTVVTKLKKANVERSGIVKVTGHKTIQSLDDYDEANEEEQGQLSYAISGGITSIHNRQYPEKFMASKSCLRLQLNFFNHREREYHCNRFRCPIHQRLD